jgi:hypothetical protein
MESLYYRYGPAETDPLLGLEEKQKLMKEWHEALKIEILNEKMTIQKFLSILNDGNLAVRYGYIEFLKICKVKYDINFLLLFIF